MLLAAGRWRWSLLLVAVTLLVCFSVLIFYFLNDFIKSKCFFFSFALRVLNTVCTTTRKNLVYM